MKNLKQVLALGMAFSLTMSTMAGAAFSDQDSINSANSDAVELLTTLDVIQGFEDGSFRPEETVTRAQMAKMIYTIRNGGNDNADAYKSATTTFKDISGHWAEGYIKYLQNTGIIAGKSETVFDPDAVVTTAEAMKMALVLGGYRADKADLTGATWFNNTVSLATTNRLTDDVYSAMNGECTRQDAAQILANALGMTAVQWSEFTQSFLNDSDNGLALGGEKITVGYKWMDLTTYVGKLVSSGDLAIDSVTKAGNNQFTVDVDTVNDVAAGKYFQYNGNTYGQFNIKNGQVNVTFKDGVDHTDLVGQEVKVLTGDKLDQVYGVYATGTSKIVESTMDKVDVEFNGTELKNGKLKVDGTSYNIYENGSDASVAKIVYADTKTANGENISTVFTRDGEMVSDKVKMIDWDNNGDYDTIFVETVSVAEITYVGTNSITIGPVGSRDNSVVTQKTFDNDEISIYEGAAKGDYVVITQDDYNNSKWKIEKTTTVTGTVDGVVKNERKVRVDGTWYTLANQKTGTPYYLNAISGTKDEFVNKDKVTLYVVGDIAYYAENTKGNDVNRPVAMVYDSRYGAGGWNNNPEAKIILPDGTKKTVTVVSVDGKKPTGTNNNVITNITAGKMYYYTINNSGEYTFTSLNGKGDNILPDVLAGYDDYKTDTDGISYGDKYGAANPGGNTIADDAIVFAYLPDTNDATVYTGKAVKDAKKNTAQWGKSDNGGALIEEYNGFNYVRMMNIEISSKDQISKTTNYGYLVTDGTYSYNSEMGCYIMEYSYWNGTEVVNVKEKTSDNKERWAVKGTVIAFTNDSEGLIKDVVEPEEADVNIDKLHYASMKGADNSYVSLVSGSAGEVAAKVTSDTVIYYVDSNASTIDKIGQTASGYDYTIQPTSDDGLGNIVRPINVAYVLNSDGNVKFMVIDVDGQLDGRGSVKTTNSLSWSDIKNYNGVYVTGNAGLTTSMWNNEIPAETDVYVEGALTITGDMPTLGQNASITAKDGITVTGDVTSSQLEDLINGSNGTVTVNNVDGDVTINNSDVKLTVTGNVTGDLTVKAGTVDVQGSVSGDVTVNEGATVTVGGATTGVFGALLKAIRNTPAISGKLTINGGTVAVKGDVVTVVINNNAKVNINGSVTKMSISVDVKFEDGEVVVKVTGTVGTLTNNSDLNPTIIGGASTSDGTNNNIYKTDGDTGITYVVTNDADVTEVQ